MTSPPCTKSKSDEVAALGAWRVFHQGDRVGALVFHDGGMEEIRPHRNRRTVPRILDSVVTEEPRAPGGDPRRPVPVDSPDEEYVLYGERPASASEVMLVENVR